MTVTVLDIKQAQSRHARSVITDAGSVTVPKPIAKALKIEVGTTFPTLDEMLARILEASLEPARERLVRLIGYRERSSAQARRSLSLDGYPSETVETLIERFTEIGLLDDARFSEMLVRTLRSSGKGRTRIERELALAGVDTDTASTALDSECPESGEHERALGELRGRAPRDRRDQERMRALLVRRGFAFDVADRVVRGLSLESDSTDCPG